MSAIVTGAVAVERDAAGEHLVEDDPDRVEVRRRAPTGWPCACSGERYCAVPMIEPVWVMSDAPGARDAEVGDLGAVLVVDDHVVGLEVAVDDAALVGEAGGAQDLDVRSIARVGSSGASLGDRAA